jgi:hypothetical protein
MDKPWHLIMHAGPGGIVGVLLGWFLVAPSQTPCRAPGSGDCVGGLQIEGVTNPCSEFAPTCQTFFGFGTSGPVYPWGYAFLGLVLGGVANFILMRAFGKGIWGEEEGS